MARRIGVARRGVLGAAATIAATLVLAASAGAQGPATVCSSSNAQVDAAPLCQKARDLFRFVTPQIGVALSGGNPIPGDAGSLGRLGKVALSARIVAVEGFLPRNSVPLSFSSATSDFGAARTIVPLPAVDAAIGVFPGVPFGLTNVGGVDLLLGATLLPSVSRNAFELDPSNGGLGFSYGLRVGVLQESTLVPGLGVSWQRRELPRTDFAYRSNDDSLQVDGTQVRSNALRLVVSKRLALFGLAAGIGQDRIESSSTMTGVINERVNNTAGRYSVSLTGLHESTKRNTAFVNASFSILAARIVAEYGWSGAGTISSTVNGFGGRGANERYRYGSVGLTARF